METETQKTLNQVLRQIREVEEKFRKIQENLALNGGENGFTKHELELLEKLISLTSEVNIAGDAISRRACVK